MTMILQAGIGSRAHITGLACCGDCEQFPCVCPRVDDADMTWLVEGGAR